MGCRQRRWYIVVSPDGHEVVVFSCEDEDFVFTELLPWSKPFRFATIESATKLAATLGGRVRSWNGVIEPNQCDDKQ